MGQCKSYVVAEQSVAKPVKQPLPRTVQRAVLYMRTGSAVTLVIGIVLAVLTVQTFKTRVANSGTPGVDTTAYQEGAVVGYVFGFVAWYLAVAGLWLWMAKANQAGRAWARITGTVFFGIYSLITFFSLIVGLLAAGAPGSGIAMFVVMTTVVTWIIGLFTVILLWSGKSAPHFAPTPTPAPYNAAAGHYRPAPPLTSTMDSIAPHQPVTDPWSTPDSQTRR